jgi:hypothetical protein
MPSKTRRKYRGGDDLSKNVSNCEKWLDSVNLSDKKDQCKQMATKLTFPLSAGTFGFGAKPLPPRAPQDFKYIKKGSAISNQEAWENVYNELFNPNAAPAPVVASSYVPPQGRQLPQCAKYNKESGKNVYLANKEKNFYSELCDSSKLPQCTQWKSTGEGMDKKWTITGPNGEFCDISALPMDTNINYTKSKLNTQSDATVNMDREQYPLRRPSTAINYGHADNSQKYDPYFGGKRRRKSRKSRR